MKIKLFTKGNEDSSCEQHATFKISKYETSMTRAYQCEHHLTFEDKNNFQIKIKLFTKENDTSIKVQKELFTNCITPLKRK